MGKQFLKIGKKWINNQPGVIAYAEESQDYDGKFCLMIHFIGGDCTQLYDVVYSTETYDYVKTLEAQTMIAWLDNNSVTVGATVEETSGAG